MPIYTAPKFPSKVQRVPINPKAGLYVLKSASNNRKVGKGSNLITKGPWKGKPLYALTLPERTTCWTGCQNWDTCYGNNSFQSVRYLPGPELLWALEQDLTKLSKRHHKAGYAIRLHILGDFYSVEYVQFWARLLLQHPRAHVYGYTHWPPDSPIGAAVSNWVAEEPRVSILRSDGQLGGAEPLPVAITVGKDSEASAGTVLCPEQTGATASCLTCGLCMNRTTSISFQLH